MEEEPKPIAVLKGTIKVYKWDAEVETENGERYIIAPNSNGFVHWVELIRCHD